MPVTIPIINKSHHPLPAYATPGASGLDVRAFLNEDLRLEPMQRALVPTGIYMAIPQGYEVQVRPRSGLALKQGITCLNTPGTIDADYRGEIGVILVNLSGESQLVRDGDRIAQLVLQRVEQADWQPTDELPTTGRNAGGFGHTGIK
jgi:dUTP pyrophosphatase